MPPTLIFVPGGLHDYGAIASGTVSKSRPHFQSIAKTGLPSE